MKKKRIILVFLIGMAVLMTLFSGLLIEIAAMSHREMLHEGLTES